MSDCHIIIWWQVVVCFKPQKAKYIVAYLWADKVFIVIMRFYISPPPRFFQAMAPRQVKKKTNEKDLSDKRFAVVHVSPDKPIDQNISWLQEKKRKNRWLTINVNYFCYLSECGCRMQTIDTGDFKCGYHFFFFDSRFRTWGLEFGEKKINKNFN